MSNGTGFSAHPKQELMRLFFIFKGASLFALVAGYILLQPISRPFVRYLLWSMTPAAVGVRGSVESGGADINFVSYGSGPPIMLLHGGLSNR